jgi:hypothetical protein
MQVGQRVKQRQVCFGRLQLNVLPACTARKDCIFDALACFTAITHACLRAARQDSPVRPPQWHAQLHHGGLTAAKRACPPARNPHRLGLVAKGGAQAAMAIKAVFFGAPPPGSPPPASCRAPCSQPPTCPPTYLPLHSPADLDDTLVLTEDADAAAFACVAALSEELLPGVDGWRLVRDWRPLFHSSPWCPHGKVLSLLRSLLLLLLLLPLLSLLLLLACTHTALHRPPAPRANPRLGRRAASPPRLRRPPPRALTAGAGRRTANDLHAHRCSCAQPGFPAANPGRGEYTSRHIPRMHASLPPRTAPPLA